MAKELMGEVLYNEALLTPGYMVEAAIGTTYSLDLETLLEIPLAFGELTGCTEQYLQRPYYLLDVISKVSSKFCVYCNAGNIYSPLRKNEKEEFQANALLGERILTLLEECVCQVQPAAHHNSFASFHPKVWIILEKQTGTENRQLKVMVMSKNLTYATDIDVCCVLTGKVMRRNASRHAQQKHQPLVDLLEWLEKFGKSAQKEIPRILKEAILRVEKFDIDGDTFDDYDFHLMGIPGYDGKDCLNDMLIYSGDTIVISPFIDIPTIEKIAQRKGNKLLITQPNSCTSEIIALMPEQVYSTKLALTTPYEDSAIVNLHEKIYFTSDYRGNRLFLGSTNATVNGFQRNIELLLSLRFLPYKSSFNKVKESFIFEGKDCAFEKATPYTIDSATQNQQRDLQLHIRRAIAAIRYAEVTEETNGTYCIVVKCQCPYKDVFISPIYNHSMKQALSTRMVFSGVPLTDLTELYILECHDIRIVVKINTHNMPSNRKQQIYDRLLNTPDKVIDYLAYMLSSNPDGYMEEMTNREIAEKKRDIHTSSFSGLSLYEDLLRTAYSNPKRIKRAVETLNKCRIATEIEGFRTLLTQIQRAIPKIEKLKHE